MNTRLVLITSDFPFGKSETFLENELPFLSDNFREVCILSLSESTVQTRTVPQNVSVIRRPVRLSIIQKIGALRHFLNPEIWIEIKRIRSIYHLRISKAQIATLLLSWERSRRISKVTEALFTENTIGYAYWCDDSALALAQLKKRYPKVPTLARCHGWDLYFEASTIRYLPFRAFISTNLSQIFPISQKGVDYISENWKIVQTGKIKCSRLGTISCHKEWKLPGQDYIYPLIVSCSNVIPLKRVDLIYKALSNITDRKLRWVHFGNGTELPALRQLVMKNEIKNFQVELKGSVTNQEILRFYEKESPILFVNVSTTEGIPVSIMEAMSFGIPVLATDVGGTAELVNQENGWLVDKDISQFELSAMIKGILKEDPSNMEKKSKEAYKTWESKFNAEKNYQLFVKELLGLG